MSVLHYNKTRDFSTCFKVTGRKLPGGVEMQKWIKRLLFFCSTFLFIGCSFHAFSDPNKEENYNLSLKEAETTPFGKYPELITYKLGKMTGSNNSNMPENDTYEDNAYTRYLKEKLNIQNEDVFESSLDYDNIVSMSVTAQDIPDIMVVSDIKQLQALVENDMLEDLSDVYKNCASDKIKEIYNSYGDNILENVTFDGKLMAIPETNIENGPSMIWLRKDWMKKLGLKAPQTLEDVEHIVSKFIEEDPGGNGRGNTIGLVTDQNLTGEWGYSYEYQTDIIFAAYGAFPKRWVRNSDGEIVYGSIQSGAKSALARLHKMYQSGILDKQFLLRSQDNIVDLICSGKCGSFFGPWWAPNNPLMDAKKENPEAEWEPYMISTDSDGGISYASQNPSYKFVVVRKGYEHPEIVVKIISVLFDYARYQDQSADEIRQYYKLNVDPTARPLAINVDFSDALSRCYENLSDVIHNRMSKDKLEILEKSYYESCENYLNNPDTASLEEWSAYVSRITACGLIANSDINKVESVFFGETSSMKQEWWKLQDLEKKAYLKIVTGEKPLSYFDDFVKEWSEEGGEKITEEVRNKVDKQIK